MKPVTTETAAGDAVEEASNVDSVNDARSPVNSSRGSQGGEGMALQSRDGMHVSQRTSDPRSTPPLRARKLPGPDPNHIGAYPGSSHCASTHWNVPPNAVCGDCRLMGPIGREFTGFDGKCKATGRATCSGNLCDSIARNGVLSFVPYSHQFDGLVKRAKTHMRPDIVEPEAV